jgi:branched-chain amino acid transport system permease protein
VSKPAYWKRIGLTAAIFLVLALIPLSGIPSYQFYILERGLQNVLVVLSLVILLGYTGQLSLGQAGLVAVGAYTYGILCVNYGLSPWLGLVVAPAAAGLVGVILGFPSFKLTGPFLVVNTIAFAEIVRILILNNEKITGGPFGLNGIPTIVSGIRLYYFMLAVAWLAAVATLRLSRSHIGLALKAIREDEVAAEAMGVHVRNYKLLAFVISSVLAGLSGVFFANLAGYLNPDSFTFNESSTYLLMVVLGGMSNVAGGILSSLAVTSLPEVLRFMARSRMVVYSLILLLLLRYTKVLQVENFKRWIRRVRPVSPAPATRRDEVREKSPAIADPHKASASTAGSDEVRG